MLILSSIAIGANLTQEIMNNQTDQENRLMSVYDLVSKDKNFDQASTIFLIVVYLSSHRNYYIQEQKVFMLSSADGATKDSIS